MKKSCGACKKPFQNGPRHPLQAFCLRKSCQLTRRNQNQQRRRSSVKSKLFPPRFDSVMQEGNQSPSEAGREAAFMLKNPLIYGLISMVTGLQSKHDIEAVVRQLWITGDNILGHSIEKKAPADGPKN